MKCRPMRTASLQGSTAIMTARSIPRRSQTYEWEIAPEIQVNSNWKRPRGQAAAEPEPDPDRRCWDGCAQRAMTARRISNRRPARRRPIWAAQYSATRRERRRGLQPGDHADRIQAGRIRPVQAARHQRARPDHAAGTRSATPGPAKGQSAPSPARTRSILELAFRFLRATSVPALQRAIYRSRL